MTENEFRKATGYNGPINMNMSVYSQITGDNLVGQDNLAFSADNPYYQQMQYARTKKDLLALRNSAVEWEANRQSLDEQRAYDDPSAQLARQRSAGLNPDLATGSGGTSVSSGSSATQAQANQDLEGMSDPLDTANTVFNGISAASGMLSAVGGFMTSGLELIKGLATFDDFVSTMASGAKIAEVAAATKQQTQASTVDAINAQNKATAQIAPLQVRTAAASTYQSESEFVKHVVDNFTDNPDANYYDIFQHYLDRGVSEEDAAIYTNATLKALDRPIREGDYNKAQLYAKEQRAQNEGTSFEFFEQQVEYANEITNANNELNVRIANFNNHFSKLFHTSQNAARQAANATAAGVLESNELSYNIDNVNFQKQQLSRDMEVYFDSLKSISTLIKSIDANIASLKKLPKTRYTEAQILSQQLRKLQLNNLGSQQMSQMFSIYSSAQHSFYSTYNTLEINDGSLMPGWTEMSKPILNFQDFTWEGFHNDYNKVQSKIIEGFMSFLKIGATLPNGGARPGSGAPTRPISRPAR